MKVFVVALLALASVAYATPALQPLSTFGYLKNVAVPLAERLRKAEEAATAQQRIIGGLPAGLGAHPHQAGLISDIVGLNGNGVCGGVLVSSTIVLTAAHCWFDGTNQAWRFEVVLGSSNLFSGGHRVHSSVVAMHPQWSAVLVRNDIAAISLESPVTFTYAIHPVALPSGSQLQETFVDESAIASGFGRTVDGGSVSTTLNQVRLTIIANSVCRFAFPINVVDSNICTSGVGGVGTCQGDSGGPLVVERHGQPLLVGLTSFGHPLGCESAMPAAFVRITSFMDFINNFV